MTSPSGRPDVRLLQALSEASVETAMRNGGRASLAIRPTPEQLARFAELTPEEPFHWLVATLELCHELATPEVRESWREHKARER